MIFRKKLLYFFKKKNIALFLKKRGHVFVRELFKVFKMHEVQKCRTQLTPYSPSWNNICLYV